jgi:hypothetical protein
MGAEWIKAQDRLPDSPGDYLMILRSTGRRWMVIYSYSSKESWSGFPVTHWGVLPEMPPDDVMPYNELKEWGLEP